MAENCEAPGAFPPDPTWRVYSVPYGPPRFSLRESYKHPLWTLPFQSLRPPDGPDHTSWVSPSYKGFSPNLASTVKEF